jgi:parvulin-like peptidyl-prolyl isomerase
VDKTEEIKEFASRAADQHIRALRKEWKVGSEEEFLSILRSHGLSLPVFRRQIERQMMADEYIRNVLREKGRTPGLADIRDYYDSHPDEFKAEDQVKWLDIFISFGQHASPRAAYDHAEMVRQKAASGADFVELAKEYDNGLARGTNGVGIGSKKGEIKPVDVEATVWALRPGEVSNLIQTPAGYHIVKVAERQYAGVRPYDAKLQAEIRDKLLLKYREAEYRKTVEDLWRKGAVRVIENP